MYALFWIVSIRKLFTIVFISKMQSDIYLIFYKHRKMYYLFEIFACALPPCIRWWIHGDDNVTMDDCVFFLHIINKNDTLSPYKDKRISQYYIYIIILRIHAILGVDCMYLRSMVGKLNICVPRYKTDKIDRLNINHVIINHINFIGKI